ncbi:hypothetical protein [Agarivorans sp. B2Z047]|uniref:hypothetical protein n=1 Tax=Agarivorans sp. B2Z047 TaxID=2652721 RepID=UPI001883F77A|nr:hypothetical protein [Agarivorans sp. B2Z047]UQN43720.1 hypothetical protein LQZ07_04415 [Agarivorans sp. B2Z047]
MKQIHTDMNATYNKVRAHNELKAMSFDIGLHSAKTAIKRLGTGIVPPAEYVMKSRKNA